MKKVIGDPIEEKKLERIFTCAFCESQENVLPGYYIHIGGDVGDRWQPPACSDIVACLRRQNLMVAKFMEAQQ